MPPITLDGSLGITTPTYGGADTSEYLVPVTAFKNRIINGAMVIDQRNAGASVTVTGYGYNLDRFVNSATQSSKFTVQRNAGSVTPPAGFINYLGCTSSAATSLGASDVFLIGQPIEGLNVADLNWGTANAQTVTVSFWVRSSLTGTFGGSITNSANNRSYPYSYTISAANTWEYKTITIAGDTTGTWLTTNGIGLFLWFSLGSGSNFSATAGSWVGAEEYSATGATSVVGTNGATFYITGVQLEVGSTATSFDYRPYGTELALCQRYFDKTFPTNVAPVQNYGRAGALETLQVRGASAGTVSSYFRFAVPMRATPTMTFFNPSAASNQARNLDTSLNCTDTSTDNISEIGGKVFYTTTSGSSSTNINSVHWTASAEL